MVLVVAASLWLTIREEHALYNDELTRQLLLQAETLRHALQPSWPHPASDRARDLIQRMQADDVQLAVIAADGRLLLGSAGLADGRRLLAAPEVQRALLAGWGSDTRPWGPHSRAYVMAAVQIGAEPALGALWLARPALTLTQDRGALARVLGMAAAIAAVMAAAFVFALYRVHRRAIHRLIRGARRLSAGDLSERIDVRGSDELAALAAALNVLRRRLAAQLDTIDRQRRMLEALVDQLHEGVVVTHTDGRVALINPAAARLLNLPHGPDEAARLVGRPVETSITQHDVQRLLLEPLRGAQTPPEAGAVAGPFSDGHVRLEVESPQGTLHLLAWATDLMLAGAEGAAGATGGRLLVLTDVTQMQRALEVRTDFIANASHELRTPLSAIRASVETLRGMDLKTEGSAAAPFLEAIERHSLRLESLVSDMLDLSRLESPGARFEPEPLAVRQVLDDLHGRFHEPLARKQLRWEPTFEPTEPWTLYANPHLLRLVLDNLVDNAIKFTDAGGQVCVQMTRAPQHVGITVRDTGCGIPPEEHTRVFERFYQVQRSRSGGAERGTGLGLSIVRHAVGAMHGEVRLESEPGRGTCVSVTVPQPLLTSTH